MAYLYGLFAKVVALSSHATWDTDIVQRCATAGYRLGLGYLRIAPI